MKTEFFLWERAIGEIQLSHSPSFRKERSPARPVQNWPERGCDLEISAEGELTPEAVEKVRCPHFPGRARALRSKPSWDGRGFCVGNREEACLSLDNRSWSSVCSTPT